MRHRNIIKGKEPIILCALASAGVIGTGILSAIATPKALKDLRDARLDKEWPDLDDQLEYTANKILGLDCNEEFPWHPEKARELTKFEVFCIMAPHYIPAAGIALGTIACIFGANTLNKKQQATLVSAYSLLEQTYRDYKAKVIEKLGEEINSEIISEIEMDQVVNDHYKNQSELPLFYDTYGKRYFNMSTEDAKDAEMALNRNYAIRGYASLNEYYALLGLDLIDAGEVLGWDMDTMSCYWGASRIDVIYDKVTTDDGLECYVIRFAQEPQMDEELYSGVVKQIL